MLTEKEAKALLPYYKNFPLFTSLVWKSIGLPSPTTLQVDIAKLLQNPPSDRMILMGFRGVAKSFITCAYVVWSLWRDPQTKIMVVSANKERADANATFIKKIINELPFLSHLKAREGQRDTQNLFDVGPALPDHSPSVKSVGIKGQLTGSRADIIVADDKL
nr:MAG TPA: Terminase [Caudoviricetes sp.]